MVWRTKGKLIINNSTAKNVVQTLRRINVDDEDSIEDLLENLIVAGLRLSGGETLLVQMPAPGTLRISIFATARCVLI